MRRNGLVKPKRLPSAADSLLFDLDSTEFLGGSELGGLERLAQPPAYCQTVCAVVASRTSRTLRASELGVTGFGRKAMPGSSTPCRTIASSA